MFTFVCVAGLLWFVMTCCAESALCKSDRKKSEAWLKMNDDLMNGKR